MKIVVSGGTGFVGRAVVNALRAEGMSVRILRRAKGYRRSTLADDPAAAAGAETVSVDFTHVPDLTEACRGADVVIHLIGIIAECGDETFEAVHLGLTRNLLQAARTAGVRRWIQMSALGTRESAASRYHRTKWAAEQEVQSSGLDWTILRPSLIYGPGSGLVRTFARMARFSPALPAIGGGHRLVQPIAVEVVARAFARAAADPGCVGRIYDLCGPERLSFREVLKAILEAGGLRRGIVTVPTGLARFQATCLEWFWPRVLRRPPPLNRDQILMLEEDNVGDGGEADRRFGLVHAPMRSALAKAGRDQDGSLPPTPGGR